MKPVIWLIGGTSEGRRLIKELAKLPVELYVSVATDYGASLIEPQPGMTVMAERMDLAAMRAFIREHRPTTNGVFSASGSGLKAVWNKVKDLFPF